MTVQESNFTQPAEPAIPIRDRAPLTIEERIKREAQRRPKAVIIGCDNLRDYEIQIRPTLADMGYSERAGHMDYQIVIYLTGAKEVGATLKADKIDLLTLEKLQKLFTYIEIGADIRTQALRNQDRTAASSAAYMATLQPAPAPAPARPRRPRPRRLQAADPAYKQLQSVFQELWDMTKDTWHISETPDNVENWDYVMDAVNAYVKKHEADTETHGLAKALGIAYLETLQLNVRNAAGE